MTEMIMTNIPRSYTAIAECLSCFIFVRLLRNRFAKKKIIFLEILFLILQTGFMTATENIDLYLWVPCMVAAAVLMMVHMYCCCEIHICDAVYFGVLAFIMSEFIASLEWQIFCAFLGPGYPDPWMLAAVMLVIDIVLGIFLYYILKRFLPYDGILSINKKEMWSSLIITIGVFTVSNIRFIGISDTSPMEYSLELGNVRTLVDAGGVAILYAHLFQCCAIRIRQELEQVQNVLQNQYVQYRQSRESVELINYKYHDLKHQIAYLKAEEDPEKRAEMLQKMEDEIKQYDTQNKTGNKVLDTILTAKNLYCAKHGISFTCVADGTLLDFMDTVDICSIFGNALDNAIESELKVADKEKRLIHVSVSKKKAFILIHFENYYEGSLQYEQGNLITQKEKKDFHGYGLKSIRYTVEKYGGAVSIYTDNNWFDLQILFRENIKKTSEK